MSVHGDLRQFQTNLPPARQTAQPIHQINDAALTVKAIDEKVLAERIIPQIPVGRLGEPEEIARIVVFLASEDAGFITGSTVSANGGQFVV